MIRACGLCPDQGYCRMFRLIDERRLRRYCELPGISASVQDGRVQR